MPNPQIENLESLVKVSPPPPVTSATSNHLHYVRTIRFDWHEFACGWGAAFVNIGVTYPIYKMIFRQMLHGVHLDSAFAQIKSEGLVYLYRGIFPPLAQKTISLALMFGVYDGTRRPLIEIYHFNQYQAKVVAGLTAGSVEAILAPFERIQTLLADEKYHRTLKNTPHAMKEIYCNYGIKEFYRGLVPILYRNGPSNALFFVLREEASFRLPHYENKMHQSLQEFLAGAFIGAFLSSLFYPLNVVKVTMQAHVGGPYQNMWDAFRYVYNDRGCKISNIYKGVTINSARAFLSWGIMNSVYEFLRKNINT